MTPQDEARLPIKITDFLRTDICQFSTLNKGATWFCSVCGVMGLKEKQCAAQKIIDREAVK